MLICDGLKRAFSAFRPKSAAAALFASIAIAGCGSGELQNPASTVPARLQVNRMSVDGSFVSSRERQKITALAASLPGRDRKNIVLFANGKIYSNRDWLRKRAHYLKRTGKLNMFQDTDGALLPMCTSCSVQGAWTWYSKASDNDYSDQATVTLGQSGCADTKLYQGEAAFAYLGGLSKGGKNAIDIGMWLKGTGTASPPSPASPNSASAYFWDGPIESHPTTWSPTPGVVPLPINCGTPVTMQFFVSEDGNGFIYLNMNFMPPNVTMTKEVGLSGSDSTALGWGVPCLGCEVKRATTIALDTRHGVTSVPSGSYYGITNPYATPFPSKPQPGIVWQSAMEQTYGSSPVAWKGTPNAPSPSDALNTGFLRVNALGGTDEAVGFNEITSIICHFKRARRH